MFCLTRRSNKKKESVDSSGSGIGSGISGYGISGYGISGSGISGSGISGSESSTSEEEGSVTFLDGNEMTEQSTTATQSLELGLGSAEYSGDGSTGRSFFSGSGNSRSGNAISPTTSDGSSGDTSGKTLVIPTTSADRELTESTAEAEVGNTLKVETAEDRYGSIRPDIAPAALAVNVTQPPATTLQAPSVTEGVNGESQYSLWLLTISF
jgi:hypothetical protein